MEKTVKYFSGKNINIDERYESGVKRGQLLGFKNMIDCFSVKLGSTLYLYGAPYSGKTQLKYEILIQLSELYGWNHLIYDPETGSRHDIKEEVIQMIAKGDFTKDYNNQITPAQKMVAEEFFNKHFYIIDSEEDIDLLDFFLLAERIEKEKGIKLHTRSIDPWDYLKANYEAFGSQRDDRYLQEALKYLLRNAQQNNCYNIVATHVRDPQVRKEGGIWYYPPPSPHDIANGQEWFRKGMAMTGVWRPEKGLKKENGEPYDENETVLLFGKLKPKGVAKPTNRTRKLSLFYDPTKHRYYEKEGPHGIEHFAAKINFAQQTE